MQVYQWHADIVESLAARDNEAARVAIVRHYGNIQRVLNEMRISRSDQGNEENDPIS